MGFINSGGFISVPQPAPDPGPSYDPDADVKTVSDALLYNTPE